MPASQIRAGNFLLALSIPLSGGSPGKVNIKLCNHMGLKCFNPKSYYIYQKVCKVQYNDFKLIISTFAYGSEEITERPELITN